jgi:hypothetical protein
MYHTSIRYGNQRLKIKEQKYKSKIQNNGKFSPCVSFRPFRAGFVFGIYPGRCLGLDYYAPFGRRRKNNHLCIWQQYYKFESLKSRCSVEEFKFCVAPLGL